MLGIALRDTGLTVRDFLALARSAEDRGYATVWIPEVGSRDALVLASLVAAATKRVRVGTGVVPMASRNPVALAIAVSTVAEAAQGRFTLGLGAGHKYTAETWYQTTWNHPRHRLRETVEVVRRILAGEWVTHDGEVRVGGFHLASAPPPVPIVVGALTPASLRLAGETADGAILNWMTADGVDRGALLVREAAQAAGREARVAAYVRVAVIHDEEQRPAARAALREHTYSYASLPAYANSIRQMGLGEALDRMSSGDEAALDELVDALCAVGEADEVRDRLRTYEKTGVDEVVAYPVPFGEDQVTSMLATLRALNP